MKRILEPAFITGVCRMGEGFYRPARQKNAGTPCVFQTFLTRQDGKGPGQTAFNAYKYRFLRCAFFVGLGLALLLCACAPASGPSSAILEPSPAVSPGANPGVNGPTPDLASPAPGGSFPEAFTEASLSLTETAPRDPAAMDALRAVLANEETFFTLAVQGTSKERFPEEYFLEEWLAQWPRPYMTIDCWALCDFDQDGTPEVVCNQCMGDNPYVERLILRYQDGAVYGYARTYRGLDTPKTDGTFVWSDGAFNFGCAAMSFDREWCTVRDISYCRLEYGEESSRLYVNGLEVTESEFESAMEDQDAKPDVEWYDYTEDIISEIFSGVI